MNTEIKQKGGKRPGAGRKKGMIQKLSGSELLKQIQRTTGKRFEQLLAEHYYESVLRHDYQAIRDYEKAILSKVIADKHEIDHTTMGESLHANFRFTHEELPEWNNIPITISTEK